MKYSLTACLLLFFGIASAQLSVRNNAYVFVQDQVLFVNDDVNLNEAESKVYLRDEAQLIQGTGTTGNSGVGELSVYQEGNVNKWAYNYWCSPVGNVLADNTFNRPFRFNQIKDPRLDTPLDPIDSSTPIFTNAYDGDHLTSPVTISTFWINTYVSSDLYSSWNYAGVADYDIATGLGFTMKGTSGNPIVNQTYDFRGKPNNGDISSPVADGLSTLIGNPYPSALDSAAFLHDEDNINEIKGTLFYWEQDTSIQSHILANYIGGYHEFTIDSGGSIVSNTPAQFQTYDGAGNVIGIPPGPPGGTKQALRYIPIGQGFMVEGAIGGTTSLVTVKNSHRVYEKESTGSSLFFRNESNVNQNQEILFQENGLSIVPSGYKRFRLNLDFEVSNTHYTRQLLLNFHDTATMGHDRGLELHRSSNLNSDAYFVQEEDIFSGLAFPFTEDLTIPLIVDIEQQQPLRFRIFDIQNFEESQGIYIHDLENDTYVNLRNQNYELNIVPGHYTERFEIVFTAESALSIADLEAQSLSINQNNSSNLLVVSNPKKLDLNSIEVYDISGKRLLDQNYKTISNRYELSTSNLSDGVYVVNVLSKSNNKIRSQKIIVKN